MNDLKLSPTEEDLMNHLWRLRKAFMKDLLEAYPEPKPASTTISTLLKRMQDKNYVGYKAYGKSRQYFPLVSKETYFAKHVKNLIRNFFNNSPAQFASFFTEKSDFSQEELQRIKEKIDEQLSQKK
ncbi:Transcriptional regulator, MecI family [Indibacter alkaliphilus LW1]|uniref:Transcriptional regulator, MecI family n=1 Tax=Indibacter alkaliphilus (strain CCUG 57479 / KCTC 22604 / LW1) TaxID=1189612 RepID=S2DL69_INDAL|nr:BlaI/MecI/CopY family transcriptional regulator [Indibacter alkaliphilus]EOZ99859.1 Transcriptional regulator, MecI family [Indibacter alkaliphilus LW1]